MLAWATLGLAQAQSIIQPIEGRLPNSDDNTGTRGPTRLIQLDAASAAPVAPARAAPGPRGTGQRDAEPLASVLPPPSEFELYVTAWSDRTQHRSVGWALA